MESPESNLIEELLRNSEIPTSDNNFLSNRNLQLNTEAVISNLEKVLGIDFLKRIGIENANIIQVNRTRIKDIATFFLNVGYKLEYIFASDIQQSLEVNYLFTNRPYVKNSSLIIQLVIKKELELDSISSLFLNAQIHETALTNRMGIEFLDIIEKNSSNSNLYCVPFEFHLTQQTQFQGQVGVFNEIHNSSSYFDINTQENQIKKVELRDGWDYRRYHTRLESSDPTKNFVPLLNEISKNHAFHNSLLYNQLLEGLNQKTVPLKAKFIRTLGAEIERIFSHLIWFTNLCDLLKMKLSARKIYKNFLKLSIYLEQYLQPKNLHSHITYGSARDISMSSARELYHYFRDNENQIFNELYKFTYSQKVVQSLSHVGVISKKEAVIAGLRGPALRGSGLAYDVRLNDPYLTYTLGDVSQVWNVITFKKGDSFARTQVRLWELQESMAICKHILHGLSSYGRTLKEETRLEEISFDSNQHYLDVVEAPQGSLAMYLRTGLKKPLTKWHSVRLLTPDRANYQACEKLLQGEDYQDLPIILHSLDLNFSMIDL